MKIRASGRDELLLSDKNMKKKQFAGGGIVGSTETFFTATILTPIDILE